MAFRIHRGVWQFKKADGAYESKYKLNDSGQLVETDADGNEIGGMTASVAWTSVSGRPTTLSSFTNDLGNYGGWITSSGSISGNAATATLASTVTINYNNNSNSTYQMLWGSGNSVYGTGSVYLNPSTNYVYASSFNAGDWFRSSGATGWYNSTYGGGWYMTDTSYLKPYNGKSINMVNASIDYASQLHFNDNVRFYDDGNDSYLNFKYGDANYGAIVFYNGGNTRKGYLYSDNAGFGLLDSGGSWKVRVDTGSVELYGTQYGTNIYAYGFYDRDNSNYYVNPASTSKLSVVDSDRYSGFVDRAYVDFTVDGDANTYYIVRIQGAAHYGFHRYSISRGYSWTAPNTWNTATHRGGLTFSFEWSGDTAWGGNDKSIRVIEFGESYSNMVAGMTLPVTGGLIVWLRGGGAQYRLHSPAGYAASVTVEYGDFTAGNGAVYSPRTDTGNVTSEIYERWPVRNNNELYVGTNAAIHAGNIGSQSVNYATSAGSAGNADTVDGYHATNAAGGLAIINANGYWYPPSWINVGTTGIYSGTNNAHFLPNTSSYGSWEIIGSKNGWSGIHFRDSGNNVMANANDSGFYNVNSGWQIEWYNGTLSVSKRANGGGTLATVLDSSNFSSWAQPAGSYAASSHTHDDRYYTESEVDSLLAGKAASSHSHSYLPLSGGTLTGQLNMHAGAYEGSIVFGSTSTWRTGIRQHDDADAELRIWAKNPAGMIFLATGYDGEPANISRPTDGLAIQNNRLGIGDFSAGDPSYKLHVKGTGYFSDTLTLTNISGAAQTVPNTYGAYLHLGTWGDGRTAAGAVLVNTAYRADYATSLFDMNISRFTNNSGYITAYGAQGANGNFYIDDNYGYGIVGAYSSTRYQGVFAMGDSYKLPADGSGTGTLYGIAWTHTNVGGESKSGLGHQALFMMNGRTYTAIGSGIWTDGTITTTSHGTSANWNTAYGWGNHASAGYAAASHSHAISDVTGLQGALDGKQAAGSYAASNHNHTYNVNDDWLRENGDNAHFKIYGNSRSVIYRTDGVTNEHGGGGYPHIWYYGGSADGNRVMIINTSGQLWMSNYGWLHDYFQRAGSYAAASHTHTPSQVGLGNVSNAAQVTTSYNSSLNSDSRNSRGVTRLYRRDDNSDYSVQAHWTGSHWFLRGYGGDSFHAEARVGYADSAGSATANGGTASNVNGGWIQVPTGGIDELYANNVYANVYYRKDNTGWYMNPGNLSNMNIIYIDRIDNYGWQTNSTWNTGGMFYVGEAGDAGAYPLQVNATRWDISAYMPNGPIFARGFVDVSDVRKKTDINDLSNALESVLDLRGVTFKWLNGEDTSTHSGLIAQEVEAVLPHVVTSTVDADTLGEVKGVNYTELIPYLIESIKSQQATIATLEARIAALENNL